jgi:hypothetical protein
MPILKTTLDHLLSNVLPSAGEYIAAEEALSRAEELGNSDSEAITAKRKAAELAVAIDGLSDRASRDLTIPIEAIREAVPALCHWPGSPVTRIEAFERVHGVANAYKHASLDKRSHVIRSFDDVLVVGLGYGLDGYGVGKFGGIEVLVRDKAGVSWKFMGDAPTVISAWFRFLSNRGAALPNCTFRICGIQVHPY